MSKIISTTDLNSFLPSVTLDSGLAQQVVDAVNQYIETRTHRCFGEIKTVTDEAYRSAGVIWLRHVDVTEVTEIKLGWPGQTQSTVNTSSYFLNPLGRLTFFTNGYVARPGYTDYVHISYKHGYTGLGFKPDSTTPLVPDDLRQAALGIAAGMYNWSANGGKEVVSASVGSYRLEYSGAVRGSGQPTPATNAADLNWSVIDSYTLVRQ